MSGTGESVNRREDAAVGAAERFEELEEIDAGDLEKGATDEDEARVF